MSSSRAAGTGAGGTRAPRTSASQCSAANSPSGFHHSSARSSYWSTSLRGRAGTMSTMPRPDVAVVGLGPVGAVAALLLARSGLRVAAWDRREAPGRQGRAVALDGEAVHRQRSLRGRAEWGAAPPTGGAAVLGGRWGGPRLRAPGAGPAVLHDAPPA